MFPSVMRLSASHACVSSRTLRNYIHAYNTHRGRPHIWRTFHAPDPLFAAARPLTPTSAHRPHRHRALNSLRLPETVCRRCRRRDDDPQADLSTSHEVDYIVWLLAINWFGSEIRKHASCLFFLLSYGLSSLCSGRPLSIEIIE